MDGSKPDRMLATILAIAGAVLIAAGCAAPALRAAYLLHPLPTAARGYEVREGAARYAGESLELELRPLDPRVVAGELAFRGLPDPFPPGRESRLLIFNLRLANRGREVLYFNPANVRGLDDRRERYFPLGAAGVYALHRDDPRRGELMAAFGHVAFDTPVQVRPGEEIARYLALETRPEPPGSLAVSIPLRYGGEASLVLSFPFEAFPFEGAAAGVD